MSQPAKVGDKHHAGFHEDLKACWEDIENRITLAQVDEAIVNGS